MTSQSEDRKFQGQTEEEANLVTDLHGKLQALQNVVSLDRPDDTVLLGDELDGDTELRAIAQSLVTADRINVSQLLTLMTYLIEMLQE